MMPSVLSAAGQRRFQIDHVAMLQPQTLQIAVIHEQDVAPAEDPAVAIVQSIDGGVVLIVAAQREP